MELTLAKREGIKKSDTKKIRREGNIPAIIYSQGKEGNVMVVDGPAMKKVLKKIVPGTLATTVFTLQGEGQGKKAVVKDIQYNITTYDVIHLDFVELMDKVPVEVKVPVMLVGVNECAGVKQGGFLRQVIRAFKVRCLPKDIPSFIEVDVKDLGMLAAIKLADVKIPNNVRPLIDLNEVVVVVGKQ